MIDPAQPHAVRVSLNADGGHTDDETGAAETSRRCADILYGTGDPESARLLLERYPGCLLVSLRDARGRCVSVSRTGVCGTIAFVRDDREHALLVSVLHQWLIEVGPLPERPSGPRAVGRPSG